MSIKLRSLNVIAKAVHANCLEKGFYENPVSIMGSLCLVHSEVSEALSADAKGLHCTADVAFISNLETDEIFLASYEEHVKGTFEEEMADIILRVLDLCAYKNIDIEAHLVAKMRYNTFRPRLHGKKY